MTPSTPGMVVCGAGFGLAVVLLARAVHTPPGPPGNPVANIVRGWWHQLRTSRARRSVPTAVAVGVLLWWATGWSVAGCAAAAAALGLPPVLTPAGPRQSLARAEALTTWCRRLADLLTAGSGGLEQALLRSAETAPEPLTGPVRRLAERVRSHGSEPALREFAAELADPTVDEIVLALLLRLQHGGRGLADTLTAHAEALAAEATSRRDIEADRATARTTVRCLIAVTLTLFAGLVAVARDYLTPLDSPTGQGVLALAAGIAAAALWWMHQLTSHTTTARYLSDPSTPDRTRKGEP